MLVTNLPPGNEGDKVVCVCDGCCVLANESCRRSDDGCPCGSGFAVGATKAIRAGVCVLRTMVNVAALVPWRSPSDAVGGSLGVVVCADTTSCRPFGRRSANCLEAYENEKASGCWLPNSASREMWCSPWPVGATMNHWPDDEA